MFYPPLQHRDTALKSTRSTVFSCYHFIAFNRRVLSCSCSACVVSHACTLLLSISLLPFVLLFLLLGGLWQQVLCASFCCCVLMEYVLLLLACFDWVCKAIWPSESSIRSPTRGSCWFEWIEPGWSTGIGSVCQLPVCMLKSCIHASKLQDYSYFNQQKVAWSIAIPCLSHLVRMVQIFYSSRAQEKNLSDCYSPAQVGNAWGSIMREF